MGHFIVDFVRLEKRLIIELDGGQQTSRRKQSTMREEANGSPGEDFA